MVHPLPLLFSVPASRIAGAVLVLAICQPLLALDRYPPPTLLEMVGRADLVVVGRVVAVEQDTYRFQIEETVLGKPRASCRIASLWWHLECGATTRYSSLYEISYKNGSAGSSCEPLARTRLDARGDEQTSCARRSSTRAKPLRRETTCRKYPTSTQFRSVAGGLFASRNHWNFAPGERRKNGDGGS